jgi:hypothetical protein
MIFTRHCEVAIHKSQIKTISHHIFRIRYPFRVYEKTRINTIASTVAGERKKKFSLKVTVIKLKLFSIIL